MRKMILLIVIIALSVLFSGCSNEGTSNQEITISAASSLTDALIELKDDFEKQNPNIKVNYNFGGSGRLAEQIEQGAPVDVFLSASKKYMDQVENKQLTEAGTRKDFASNEMVLITNKANQSPIDSFEDLISGKINKVAIGNPDTVPAGKYAKDIFDALNLWDTLQDKFVLAKNVRQVLAYVESENADYGIVYSSDALISNKVKVVSIANKRWHQAIVYPAAIIKDSQNKKAAGLFLDYLNSEKGRNILIKYGFK